MANDQRSALTSWVMVSACNPSSTAPPLQPHTHAYTRTPPFYQLQVAAIAFMAVWTVYAAYTASLGEITTKTVVSSDEIDLSYKVRRAPPPHCRCCILLHPLSCLHCRSLSLSHRVQRGGPHHPTADAVLFSILSHACMAAVSLCRIVFSERLVSLQTCLLCNLRLEFRKRTIPGSSVIIDKSARHVCCLLTLTGIRVRPTDRVPWVVPHLLSVLDA